LFTRVVNHCVIVHGTRGRDSECPARTIGAILGRHNRLLELEHEFGAWRKNRLLAISYADSGRNAYGALASENQVLLTMAG
jgi:hypothetical protein